MALRRFGTVWIRNIKDIDYIYIDTAYYDYVNKKTCYPTIIALTFSREDESEKDKEDSEKHGPKTFDGPVFDSHREAIEYIENFLKEKAI